MTSSTSSPGHVAASSPRPGTTLLEARALACQRGYRTLFADLSFAVRAGEMLHVYGPNGSGKTTLLRVLAGLGLATDGIVHRPGSGAGDGDEAGTGLRFLGHADGIKLDLTAGENLATARALHGGAPWLEPRAALARLGVEHLADLPARVLSAGQRRRVALAGLLLRRAELWILDEPLAALDRSACAHVEALLAEHLDARGAVVVTSHQPLALAARYLTTALDLAAPGPPAGPGAG